MGKGYFMLPCPAKGAGQWCCSQTGEDCCESASSVSIPPLPTPTPSPSPGSLTSPADATARPTDAGTHGKCDNKKSTSVGAGVGVALGACLLGSIGGLIFQHRMHKQRLRSLQEELAVRMTRIEPMQYGQAVTSPSPSELANTQKPTIFELGSQHHL